MSRRSGILLGILMLPAALAWGELFTRRLMPQAVDVVLEILAPDPVLGYVYAPGARGREKGLEYDVPYAINSLGLRDREYDLADTTAFRVLLLGDSYAVGHAESLQYSLPRALERALRERAAREGNAREQAPRIEVVNAANAGYSPYHYARAWRKWGPLLGPDVVVVALALANDWDVEPEDAAFLVRDGRLEAVYRAGEPPPVRRLSAARIVRRWLARHSQLYVLGRNYLAYDPQTRWLRPASRGGAGAPRAGAAAGRDRPTPVLPFLTPPSPAVTGGWERAARDLARLRDDAAADGVPVVVALVPVIYQVVPERLARMLRNQRLTADRVDLEQPNRVTAALCAREGLPCVDLLPALRARQARVPCYFAYDDHWNREGIAAAAAALAAALPEPRGRGGER